MKLSAPGKNTSRIEVQNVSPYGVSLYISGKEYYLPQKDYPWFRNAKLSDVYDVQLIRGTHLRWPRLDIDLELESLEDLEKYPLIYR